MATDTKYEKCPVCQGKLKCAGKYETLYVYQCSNPKCRRKFNQDAIEAGQYENKKRKSK